MPQLREDEPFAIGMDPGRTPPGAGPASLPPVAVVQLIPMRADPQQLLLLKSRLGCSKSKVTIMSTWLLSLSFEIKVVIQFKRVAKKVKKYVFMGIY